MYCNHEIYDYINESLMIENELLVAVTFVNVLPVNGFYRRFATQSSSYYANKYETQNHLYKYVT